MNPCAMKNEHQLPKKLHTLPLKKGDSEMQKDFSAEISKSYLTSQEKPEINLYQIWGCCESLEIY